MTPALVDGTPIASRPLLPETGLPDGPQWRAVLAMILLALTLAALNTQVPDTLRPLRSAPIHRIVRTAGRKDGS